jgi:hypothetical protein
MGETSVCGVFEVLDIDADQVPEDAAWLPQSLE